jgi:hypothetical protein
VCLQFAFGAAPLRKAQPADQPCPLLRSVAHWLSSAGSFERVARLQEMPTLSVSQPAREAERAMAVLPRAVPAEACKSSLRHSEVCRSSYMPGHESLAEAASETLSVRKGVIRWTARHVAPRFRTLSRMTSRLPLCTAQYIRALLILHRD